MNGVLCRQTAPVKTPIVTPEPHPCFLPFIAFLSCTPNPDPAPVFLLHASPLGLTPEEKGTVLRLRSLVKGHVSSLCGDLSTSEMWRKYGAFNSVTKNFDFNPDW